MTFLLLSISFQKVEIPNVSKRINMHLKLNSLVKKTLIAKQQTR